ncbi:MAG: TrpB-like pyridoxal phosphate-dependent enzyme [Candidatus Thermoplasmatota archaeon]
MNRKITLDENEIPKKWYNILPDLPKSLPPPKDPENGPSRIKNLPKIFSKGVLQQENAEERFIEIPTKVRELYIQSGRPRPLYRAKHLEQKLNTPAKLYYKSEFYSPTGSHKVNTAIPQAYYAKKQGIERMTTETGAGQWGSALAYACTLLKMKLTVYWVKAASEWKPERRSYMKLCGANVFDSPSNNTKVGRELLKTNPNHQGSLGIAIAEAIQDAVNDTNAVYSLGSVLNHVLLHQTIIGLECKKQMKKIDEYPDLVISCLGGGSNFGGIAIPFIRDKIKKKKEIKFIASQSEVAPNLKGKYRYDYGDYAEQTPLIKMCTLGHKTFFQPIKADGLRYHAAAPIISALRKMGMIDTIIYPADENYVFQRAKMFLQSEGFLPAPESAYSIAAAIDEAKKCKKTDDEKTILFNVSGHGFMDMEGYQEKLKL